jgi:NAD(P)-dependent dehydrogenase (short-subunit alcohol dehydrogenase family)
LILNAGINAVDNDESFDLAAYKAVMETNLYGVLHFVAPLLEVTKPPGQVHIVAVSSLAGFVGNPYGLGYFSSKRALTSCFDVWARMYAGTDLIFQQVILGPVPTEIKTMADHLPAWMVSARDLFSGTQKGAARAIFEFAATGRSRLYYPRRAVPLFLGMKMGQSLIPGFYQGRRTLDGRARRTSAEEPR